MNQPKLNVVKVLTLIALSLILLLLGCDRSVHDSEVWGIYKRTNSRGDEVERITKIHFMDGHEAMLTPEGPKFHGLTYKMRYYFSGPKAPRNELSFLKWDDPGPYTWDTILPVEETNLWIRIQALCEYYQDRQNTNSLLMTVFSPQAMLYQREIKSVDCWSTNYLTFSKGNRVVTYREASCAFIYDIVNNDLYQTNRLK